MLLAKIKNFGVDIKILKQARKYLIGVMTLVTGKVKGYRVAACRKGFFLLVEVISRKGFGGGFFPFIKLSI